MVCQNCGSVNKEGNKFCFRCGAELRTGRQTGKYDFSNEMFKMSASVKPFESEKTVSPDELEDFENDETVILDDEHTDDVPDFENDETVILCDETPDDVPDFENDETVILCDEMPNDVPDFENDETVILDDEPADDVSDFENDETVILCNELETPPPAPSFNYRTVYKEYRTSAAEETAYIDHLRRLKELLDDGIITEDEFTRKKQQILGI